MKRSGRMWSWVAWVLLTGSGGVWAEGMTAEKHEAALKPLLEKLDKVNEAGPYRPTVESLETYRVPEWYADAKLGIFVHYGLFSATGCSRKGCWYGNFMYRGGHPVQEYHIKQFGPLDKFGYKDLAPLLTGEKFDADGWVTLFKEAGARFVVPVSCFHDGFAMWDSKLTDWTSVKTGPKFDYDERIAAAARKQGLKFGVAWHAFFRPEFFGHGRHPGTDIQPPHSDTPWSFYGPREITPEFLDDCLGRLVELVDGYQPDLFWFDFDSADVKPEVLRRFAAYYFNRAAEWRKGVAINDKSEATFPRCIVLDYERGKTSVMRPDLWQTDTSVSWKDWSYTPQDSFKSSDELIRELVDIVSKNGVLLLNIGPKPDGSIPPEPERLLRAIGAWLKVNGEAIYDTRPCWALGFGEGRHNSGGGGFSDRAVSYDSSDFRFTRKGDAIYVFAMEWPGDEDHFLVRSMREGVTVTTGGITGVELLGSDEAVKWKVTPEGLWISRPARRPAEAVTVFKVTTAGTCLEKLEPKRLDARRVQLDVLLRNVDLKPARLEIALWGNGKPLRKEVFEIPARSAVARPVVLEHEAGDMIERFTAVAPGGKPFALGSMLASPVAAGEGRAFVEEAAVLAAGGMGKLESFSVCLWMKADSLREKMTGLVGTLNEKPSGMQLFLAPDGSLQLAMSNAEGADTRFQSTLTPGADKRWHHVVATYDGEKRVAGMWLNGVREAERPAERQTAVDFGAITIGGPRDKQCRFSGNMSDVRIYRRALSAAEIGAVANGREVKDGLVAAWEMKRGDGGRVADVSGHGHDATEWSGEGRN